MRIDQLSEQYSLLTQNLVDLILEETTITDREHPPVTGYRRSEPSGS